MSSAQTIRLNQLLLAREAQFVRVHELEQAAARLLGEPYPFSRPILPSDGARARRKPAAAARGTTAPRDRLRRLEEGEAAYRVTYRQFGKAVTEEHDELDAIRVLLASQGGQVQVLRVETIDGGGRPGDVLYTAAAAAPKQAGEGRAHSGGGPAQGGPDGGGPAPTAG